MVEPQPTTPRGFAGLAALGVDVSAALGPATAAPSHPDAAPTPAAGAAPRRQSGKPYQGAQSARGGRKRFSNGLITIASIIAIIVGLTWFGAGSDRGSATTESMPPVGTNQTLSSAELRYCLAEYIRLQGAQSAISDAKQSDLSLFRRMVDDYNSRCSSYRYRSGTLESARRDIEPNRERLRAEGAARFGR
jgi:hypothetical protein